MPALERRLPADPYPFSEGEGHKAEAVNLIEFMFNNYRHRAPPSPCPGSSRGGAGAGAYAPSSEDGSPKSDFQKIKKGPQGQAVVPPQDTPNFKTLYIIYLCVPGGGEGHLAASWRGAPGSPTPTCLFSHFISSDTSHYRHPLPPPLLLTPLQSGRLAGPSECPWGSKSPTPPALSCGRIPPPPHEAT